MDTSVDPWIIQPRERARYEEQFKSLNPINGIVTGVQAKGFFMQSQLPVDVLGKIWSLADVDSDGKLDINEFSIACKLINLKLRGFPLPATLPPTLRSIFTSSPTGVTSPPFIPQQPFISSPPFIPPAPQPAIPPQPIIPVQPVMSVTTQPIIPAQPIIPTQPIIPPQPVIPAQPVIPPQAIIPPQPIVQTQPTVPPVPAQPVLPHQMSFEQRQSLTGLSTIPAMIPSTAHSVPDPVRTLDRKASLDVAALSDFSAQNEWAVPYNSKLKYTQMFNSTDRSRTGFIAGSQARNIMLGSGLPQKTLAQIWALADTDADGRLSCEEFVLALHLCDLAKEGRPLPAALPPELVPPTIKRKRGASFSVASETDKSEMFMGMTTSASFEDKRKENFDKGQAELDRRRAILLEAQRKEQEEKERREREEAEKRDKLRLEEEARRQAELQLQLLKQKELEEQQEEQRRRAEEQREAARKEAERLRILEWERTRTQELESQRQKIQETVLKLKSRNQGLTVELSTLNTKVKELTGKISQTRTGVSQVKATIDGMRTTRDTHMSEMAALKARLKDQNQRLLLLTQEKAKLEARNKANAAADTAASEQFRVALTNKQISIKQLTEKLSLLQEEVKTKTDDYENNRMQVKELRTKLKSLLNECESLYDTYAAKRDAVFNLKATIATSGSTWGTDANAGWEATPASDTWADQGGFGSQDDWGGSATVTKDFTDTDTGYRKARALYEFSSRNPDELTFEPGEIIMVPINQKADPGWLSGELRGVSGWFPESYVEFIDDVPEKQPLEGIIEVPETINEIKVEESDLYVALYSYQSAEVGDLTFDQGEQITVVKKDGEWWTGYVGDRSGIFPANYVQKYDSQAKEPSPVATSAYDTPLADDDNVFAAPDEIPKSSKSPGLPSSTSASGRETPADFERVKPATPDFSAITPAQTKIGKKGEIATVIAPYQGTSPEQLSLTRGQLVCIRKKTTTGWWEGELQAKGRKKQVGWFPASYVKVMSSRRLSQSTPDYEAEMNATKKVIAMFPYKAQNEDELTFEKDDIITVVARDDPAWWKGEINGVTGLFPSNYVMPVDSQSSDDRLRQEAIQELVESERAYTNDMHIVQQVFEKPLRKCGFVTKDKIDRIFLNWHEILKLNYSLLKRLEERKRADGSYDCVGDILSDNFPKMNAYVRFCSCQLQAGALLQELTDTSELFRDLCKQCQIDPRTQGLPLSTFLIKPMQRITRYSLLIAKILENTPTNHPDYFNLKEALQRADYLCLQVNEGVRERENSERLEWLQNHVSMDGLEEPFIFNSFTKSMGPRKFLHYGLLTKVRSGKELVGFLLSDYFILALPQRPIQSSYLPLEPNSTLFLRLYKKPFLVKELSAIKTTDGNDKTFTLNVDKDQSMLLSAPTTNDVTTWVKNITIAREKCSEYEQSKSRRKSDGLRAVGRLLAEVVEAVNIEARNLFVEMKLGSQIHSTPPCQKPFKWNFSTQFQVRNISRERLFVSLMSFNQYSPNDLVDRAEINVQEIFDHTRSGRILRRVAMKNGHVHIKFDLVLFEE